MCVWWHSLGFILYKAKRISKQATEFVRRLGTLEDMQEMFNEFFERPLHQALDAYQPLEDNYMDDSLLSFII